MRPSSAETSEPACVNRKMLSMKSRTSWPSSSRKYSAAEEARLAAFRVGLQEIDDLDAGFEHLDPRRLLVERRRRAMDRVRLLGVDGGPLVDGLADDVEDAAERFFADRNRDRRAGVQHAT